MDALKALAIEDAIFFPAAKDCITTLPGGGQGSIGQIFSASGKSYSETLIHNGLAQIDVDPCGGHLIQSCYDALVDEGGSNEIAGELNSFLWKPQSDSNGLLAVHSGPYNSTVRVNGETGTNAGPGNGFGSLARFSKSGCGYGGNVQVEVLNAQGLPYVVNGQRTITIPSGCNRYCLEGGSIVQCVKK